MVATFLNLVDWGFGCTASSPEGHAAWDGPLASLGDWPIFCRFVLKNQLIDTP